MMPYCTLGVLQEVSAKIELRFKELQEKEKELHAREQELQEKEQHIYQREIAGEQWEAKRQKLEQLEENLAKTSAYVLSTGTYPSHPSPPLFICFSILIFSFSFPHLLL